MKKKKVLYNISVFLITGVIFFALTMPFRQFFNVSGMTELRPATGLPPAFGLLFGVPGALGCAVANLIADIISGDAFGVCFFGFFSQLIFGILPIFLWKLFKGEEVRLDNLKNFVKVIGTFLINALVSTVLTFLIIHVYYGVEFLSHTTLFILFNNVVFGIILGIPIIICVGYFRLKKAGRRYSLNEKLVLTFFVLGIISADLTGALVYIENSRYISDVVTLWNRVYFYTFIDLFLFYNVTWLALWNNEKNITKPLGKMTKIAQDYTSSPKDHEIYSKLSKACEELSDTGGEIGGLSNTFGEMINSIEQSVNELTAINAEKERIGTELAIAKSIQAHMLPIIFPPFPNRSDIDIFASMTPAKEVGGDLYDFFFVDEETFAIVIADVSGKGVPASLFMAVSKILIKNLAMSGKTPDEIFTAVNAQFCENNEENMFVTAWMAIVNIKTGKAVYANAGHNPPLVSHGGGDFEYLKSRSGLVLGAMGGIKYRRNESTFAPGDKIFLYTDGVTESNDRDGKFYGDDRLKSVVNGLKNVSATEMCKGVAEDIEKFTDGAPQFDDITMLMFSVNPDSDEGLSLFPDEDSLKDVQVYFDNFAQKNNIDMKLGAKINIIMDEMYSNIFKYSEASLAKISAEKNEDGIVIKIIDNGVAYNPLESKEPDITAGVQEREIGGLGLHLVKKMARKVQYERVGETNVVTILV